MGPDMVVSLGPIGNDAVKVKTSLHLSMHASTNAASQIGTEPTKDLAFYMHAL